MLMRTKESHVFFLLLPPPEAKFNAKLLAQRSYRRPILPRYVSVFDFFSPASPTLLLAPVRKVTGVKFRSFRWKTSALCFRYDSRYFKAWIMASETTNSVRIRSTIVRKSQRGYTCVSVDVSYIYIYIEKRKSAYALVFRNVFHRRCPRCDGQTYEKRWKSSTLLHLPVRYCLQRIHSIAIICFCTLAFVCVHGSFPRFFSLLLSCAVAAYPVSTLFAPFCCPREDCCCGFLSRYVPRIRSFRFYLASGPFVTRIVPIYFV